MFYCARDKEDATELLYAFDPGPKEPQLAGWKQAERRESNAAHINKENN